MATNKLVIVRGLPGSGKSTYARSTGYVHFEADMMFEDKDGVYTFDPILLNAAHSWCFGNTVKALTYGFNVVVSNTFCAMWEMEQYITVANHLGIPVEIVEVKTSYGSIRGVPEDAIERMKNRWEEAPAELVVKVIQ